MGNGSLILTEHLGFGTLLLSLSDPDNKSNAKLTMHNHQDSLFSPPSWSSLCELVAAEATKSLVVKLQSLL